jgi:hypothetical protein
MKTEKQIQIKITQHEMHIETEFQKPIPNVEILETLKKGRTALQWVLSDSETVEPDELTKKIDWEITCQEASNLF